MSTKSDFVSKKQAVAMEKTIVVKSENLIDFSLTPCLSGDVVEALDIPEGAFVESVVVDVLLAEAGNVTVGDGDSATGWDTTVSVASTGATVGDGAYVKGKVYRANDTIDLTLDADMNSGKVNVFAIYSQLENS